MTSTSAITAVDLSKAFSIPHETRGTLREHVLHPLRRTTHERNQALQEVSFEVGQGEFFGVIGPNGSGKSTLLRILAGIYAQDSGTVDVRGRLSPFIELGVGFNLELTARDNVVLTGTLLGLTRQQLDEKFDEILAFAELERFIDQKLNNFSSGMLLRLAYSIAIQVPFDILLLDEVLAVGDESFQEKCYRTLIDIRHAGKTVVLVSHNLYAVARLCERVMLLRNGVVEALGRPDEVIRAYREQEGTEDPWPAAAPAFEETKSVWEHVAGGPG
ncbi:MAG: ABC transporter ATP-binding protein [Actinobacteria bacterium]|nr:ABC transporter ATP-binding protein [Actinomycetota bacterium]